MVAGVFAELGRERAQRRFTVGINDDVSGTSIAYDPALDIEPPETMRAVFFGLGSDGTVGANKNTIKILGAEDGLTPRATSSTTPRSRARRRSRIFASGPEPIRAPYLVSQASFVGCHQFGLLERDEVLRPCRARGDACCSTRRTRPSASGTRSRARCRSRCWPSGSRCT